MVCEGGQAPSPGPMAPAGQPSTSTTRNVSVADALSTSRTLPAESGRPTPQDTSGGEQGGEAVGGQTARRGM